MKTLYRLFLVIILIVSLQQLQSRAQAQTSTNRINLNPSITYQTMEGWEATDQLGQTFCLPGFNTYKQTIFDKIVDVGINRLRVEVKPSGSTFDLVRLDRTIDLVVLPLKQKLEANGEKLWLNFEYVGNSSFGNDPTGYSQAVLETYRHVQSKYGFIPDSWEVILEPGWSVSSVINNLNAAGDLIKANGYPTYFLAPTNANMFDAITYFDQIIQNPKSREYLKEFSYHRYGGGSLENAQIIGQRGKTYGVNTAMLEHIGSAEGDLHTDLKYANNSAWQQYTLLWCEDGDNGAHLFYTSSPDDPNPVMGSRTKFLRQYFKYIRKGAKRIEAATNNDNFDPVAFINANGRYTVVTKVRGGGSFSVTGLPAGIYGVFYSTDSQFDMHLPDQTINSGQTVVTSIPTGGVITIFAKGGTSQKTDINRNGRTDIFDLSLLIKDYGQTTCGISTDITGDCKVDFIDFTTLIQNF